MLGAALTACGGGPATTQPATPGATLAPSATTLAPTATPLPVIPVSGVVAAGTYGWRTFEPHLVLVIPAGWQVGHRHDDYFDLFPATATGGGGPGVGFGRFTGVYGPNGAVPLTTAEDVVDTLVSNPALHVERHGATQLLGLRGQAVRISVDEPSTRLFDEAAAPFQFDPGWTAQCWFLDVEGGVLFVGVFGHSGVEAADLATAQPLLDGVSLLP